MNSLDEGIKALEDMDYFFSLLHQIGGAHTRVPGFKKEFFWVRNAVTTLLDFLTLIRTSRG